MAIIKSLHTDGQDGVAEAHVFACLSGLILTIFLAPLFLVLYLVVKADGGPALVRHEHTRPDGTSLRGWRFRTVPRVAPEAARHVHGPSLTAVGRLLHRTRTDTLPLLYNVVRGELTLSDMLHDA